MNKNATETISTFVDSELEKFLKLPYIYGFTIGRVPNAMKIGFTMDCDSNRRLKEWKNTYYPDLKKEFELLALINNRFYIDDHTLHKGLKKDKNKHNLQPDEFPEGVYRSREFYADTTKEDVFDEVEIIKSNIENGTGIYKCLDINNNKSIGKHYKRNENLRYELRKMQRNIVKNFEKSIEKGINKMLCVSTTRSGKSLVSLECSKKIKNKEPKVIVVVSGKDTKDEWQSTTEQPMNTDGFYFLESDDLFLNPNAIAEKKKEGNVVIFLTLQDLTGKDVKEKHKELFKTNVDLLVVDETHFAARAPEYGEVLRNKDIDIDLESDEDENSISEESVRKYINAKYWLHLTATPNVTILKEFSPDAIIGYYTDKDLINERDEWLYNNSLSDNPKPESKSPYAGLPNNMFITNNLSEAMKDMKYNGSFLNDLFETKSINKSGDYTHFKKKQYVLNFLMMLDGAESNPNVLSIFSSESIKKNGLGNHQVWILPFRASCDAMVELIQSNLDKFKNLKDYVVINLAGLDNKYKNTREFKEEIDRLDVEGKKTITLTVKKCLTGNTIPPWDSLLFLSDKLSYTEYWQAVGRLKSSNIRDIKDVYGNVLKAIMKYQTLCIDFNPYRLLTMVEMKSRTQATFKGKSGNDNVLKELKSELEIIPILFYEELKLSEATPINILDKIREYSRNNSIHDVVKSIVDNIDSRILNDENIQDIIKNYDIINRNRKNNSSKSDYLFGKEPSKSNDDPNNKNVTSTQHNEDYIDDNLEIKNGDNTNQIVDNNSEIDDTNKEENSKKMRFMKLLETILRFAILTKSKVISLKDIIDAISTNADDIRIANNINLDINDLNKLYKAFIDGKYDDMHRNIDYAILDENRILNDFETLSVKDKVIILQNKFSKMSDNEIITSNRTAEDMITMIVNNADSVENLKFLDIASKQGEFAFAIHNILAKNNPDIVNKIFSIPTSTTTYEFTRKVYELLGLPLENIIENYKSKDIISKNNEDIIKKIIEMNINAIVSNPPFNEKDGGAGASSKPIYNQFIEQAKKINPRYISMIIPSKWYAGGKGLSDFRDNMLSDKNMKILHDFNDEKECFTCVSIRGGVCYFLWDNEYNGNCEVINHVDGKIVSSVKRSLLEDDLDVFIRHNEAIPIFKKVMSKNEKSFNTIISSRKPFGLPTNFSEFKKNEFKGSIKIYNNQGERFVDRKHINKNLDWIDKYKIYIPKAIGEGDMSKDQLKPIMSGFNTCCTETYLVVGPFENKIETQNVYTYMKTKFFHFMLGLKKISQDTTSKVYQFVPLQNFTSDSDIDWNKSIKEIDQQLYTKYGLSSDEIDFIESKIKPMS